MDEIQEGVPVRAAHARFRPGPLPLASVVVVLTAYRPRATRTKRGETPVTFELKHFLTGVSLDLVRVPGMSGAAFQALD